MGRWVGGAEGSTRAALTQTKTDFMTKLEGRIHQGRNWGGGTVHAPYLERVEYAEEALHDGVAHLWAALDVDKYQHRADAGTRGL